MRRSTIIIPAFNQAALTAQCLEALLSQGHRSIVVVDDGSTDTTPKILAGFKGQIKVVTHKANRGFARSCNDGAALASGDYLIFLNNDTLPQAGWLEALLDYAGKNPRAAVVGSKLLYPNQTIQHAGVVICQDRYPRHIYTGFPADHPAVSKSRRFQVVTAACALVRRRVFERMEGFDAAFRNGFEDVDLCLRLGQAGHEIHYCSSSVVHHLESVSPGRFKHDRRNVGLYRKRWLGPVQPDDVRYYLEDGLLSLSYEGSYPFHLEVSPRLAVLDGGRKKGETEWVLAESARQVTDLTRENARLRAEVGRCSADSPALKYERLRQQIREVVCSTVPEDAKVLVVSKGDRALLELDGREGWHFPQTGNGAYCGHHPANSEQAIEQVEALRAKGAGYLVVPTTSSWWLEHYQSFAQHLNQRYETIGSNSEACVIFDLRARPQQAVHVQA